MIACQSYSNLLSHTDAVCFERMGAGHVPADAGNPRRPRRQGRVVLASRAMTGPVPTRFLSAKPLCPSNQAGPRLPEPPWWRPPKAAYSVPNPRRDDTGGNHQSRQLQPQYRPCRFRIAGRRRARRLYLGCSRSAAGGTLAAHRRHFGRLGRGDERRRADRWPCQGGTDAARSALDDFWVGSPERPC
jgi:hypothetical protein